MRTKGSEEFPAGFLELKHLKVRDCPRWREGDLDDGSCEWVAGRQAKGELKEVR